MACPEFLMFSIMFSFLLIAVDCMHSPTRPGFFKDKESITLNVVPWKDLGQDSVFIQKTIPLNVRLDEVTENVILETKTPDIAYHGWSLFYKKLMQVHKVIFKGEADLGEPVYQSMCFITKLNLKDIVDYNDMKRIFKMMKGSKAKADIDLGNNDITMKFRVEKNDIGYFGENMEKFCSDANHIYASQSAVKQITNGDQALEVRLFSLMKKLPNKNESFSYPICKEATPMWDLGCICSVHICIPLYPCGMLNCATVASDVKAEQSKSICGISTCRACKHIEFFVERRKNCFWDRKD